MTTYSEYPHNPQGLMAMVENLDFADAVPSIADLFGWEPVHVDEHVEARSAIIHAYLYRDWGALEAFNALVSFGLFGDVDSFMETYSAGVEALAARMPLPPTPLPPASPGMRQAPSECLLDVLAPNREGRAA